MNDSSKTILESLYVSTSSAVMNMKPGIAIDTLVAVKIMGWEIIERDEEQPNAVPYISSKKYGMAFYPKMADEFKYLYPMIGMLSYSTNIAMAWEVVNEMAKTNRWRITSPFEPDGKWFAGLGPHYWNGRPYFNVGAQHLPEAICKAALLCKLNLPKISIALLE